MLRPIIILPRISLKANRRLGFIGELFRSKIEAIQSVRKGSKISRLFRLVFEHKYLKQIFGANIALAIVASSVIPAKPTFAYIQPQVTVTPELVLTTKQRGIQLPLSKLAITQGFRSYHPGVDLDGVTGDPVKPIMPGIVTEVLKSKFGYGNAVIVNHGDNLISLYAHLSKIEVTVGQSVDLNTQIGKVGSTGHSTGDHLHLEIRQDGRPINPFSLLPK